MSASGGPHRRSANSQSTDSTGPALDGRRDACSTCYAGTGLAVPLRRRACSLGLTHKAQTNLRLALSFLMSTLPLRATEQRTSEIGSEVPRGDLSRCASRRKLKD